MKYAHWTMVFLCMSHTEIPLTAAAQPNNDPTEEQALQNYRWNPFPPQKVTPSAITVPHFIKGTPGMGAAIYASKPQEYWLALGQALSAKHQPQAIQQEQAKVPEKPAMKARFAFDDDEVALLRKLKPVFVPKNTQNYADLLAFEKIVDKAFERVDSLLESETPYNTTAYESVINYRTTNRAIKDLINYFRNYITEKISFNPQHFSDKPLLWSEKWTKHVQFAPEYIIDRERLDRLKDFIHALKHPILFQTTMTFQPVYQWGELP